MKILLLLISLILCVLAQTPPTPPLYPTPSHALQLSICQSVSVFCPPGFNNNTIASQTYYDYDNNRSSAQDTNSLNSPSDYNIDQTFISQNENTLTTRLYWVAPGNNTIQCFSTVVPGGLPSPTMLLNATYIGQETFQGINCNIWRTVASTKIAELYYYVNIATNTIVGFATYDKSQFGYILDLKQTPLNEKAFYEPEGISCPPVGPSYLSSVQKFLVRTQLLRLGVVAIELFD